MTNFVAAVSAERQRFPEVAAQKGYDALWSRIADGIRLSELEVEFGSGVVPFDRKARQKLAELRSANGGAAEVLSTILVDGSLEDLCEAAFDQLTVENKRQVSSTARQAYRIGLIEAYAKAQRLVILLPLSNHERVED